MHNANTQRVGELLRGIIEVLWNRTEGAYSRNVINSLPEVIRLTEFEREILPPANMPRFERTARLTVLTLVQAGWMAKTDREQWLLTETGRNACRNFQNPEMLFLEALKLSKKTLQAIPEIIISIDAIQETAWEINSNFIRAKSIAEIRQLISLLLEAMQFHVIWTAHPQKTHGLIDIIASTDPLGAKANRILVHIKHTGQPVTQEGIRSFLSILGINDFGLFFSTSGFTTEAQNAINKGDFAKINAMDLEKFFDMWIQFHEKADRTAHQLLPLKTIYLVSPLA